MAVKSLKAMGHSLHKIAILMVLCIPLVTATKETEFKYECFKNHKNYKGKCIQYNVFSINFHIFILIDANQFINLF